MDLLAEQFAQFLACGLADFLDPAAALAEHDRALVVAHHHDLLVDLDAAIGPLDVFLGAHRAVVGQFLMQLAVQLFTRDLGGEQAFAGVRYLILGIHPRTLGHERGKRVLHLGHAVAGQRGDEIDLGEIDLVGQLLRQREQRFLLRRIDLVEHEDLAFGPAGDLFEQRFELVPPLLHRIDQQQHRVGGFRALPCRADHRPVEPPLGRENARRVDQDHLRFRILARMQRNAHHPRARGLRLGAGDCHLLPDQLVDQRALARIGGAEDGDDAAFRFRVSHVGSIRPARGGVGV